MAFTTRDGAPFVNHLPFLLERPQGLPVGLLGHMAQANPHRQDLAEGQETLAVFQSPHAYVSPNWYGSPGVHTWNYAAVHLRGKARLIEDGDELETLLARQTLAQETRVPPPWQPNLSRERRTQMLA